MVLLFIDEVRGNYLKNSIIIFWYKVVFFFLDILSEYSSLVLFFFIYCVNIL